MWWIEDRYENYQLGLQLGLRSILMQHGHNINQSVAGGHIVKNWEQIHDLIVANQ